MNANGESPLLHMPYWTLVRLVSRASVAREPCKCPTNGMQVSHTEVGRL